MTLTLTAGADAQQILDAARQAGPLERFSFVRRRLSEVFREAVGLADLPPEMRVAELAIRVVCPRSEVEIHGWRQAREGAGWLR